MNIFYKLYDKYDTKEKVDGFYANRRYISLFYNLMGYDDKMMNEMEKRVTEPTIKDYINISEHIAEEAEFVKNAKTGQPEYAKSNKDDQEAYLKYWNYDGNYDVLKKIKRPSNSLFPLDKIKKFLISKKTNKSTPMLMRIRPKYTTIGIPTAIKLASGYSGLYILKSFSLICLFVNMLVWLRDKIFTKFSYTKNWLASARSASYYSIHDGKRSEGDIYIVHDCVGQNMTIPLGFRCSIVRSPPTSQMVHEILHGVQNSFTMFYEYPKELIELVPMVVETIINSADPEFSEFFELYKNRNIALALADIEADDPVTFDEVFNRESGSLPIKLSNRFWHYLHYPKKYYAYALGLLINVDASMIPELLTSPNKCKEYIDRLIE